MYEQGNLEKLESILTPSVYTQSNAPDDLQSYSGDNHKMADLPPDDPNVKARTVTRSASKYQLNIVQDDQMVKTEVKTISEDGTETVEEVEKPAYPEITDQIRKEITQLAKEWIKIYEALDKLKNTRNELERRKRLKEADVLRYIQTYGLKDITMGKHQLVPKIVKGKKKGMTKNMIRDSVADFFSTLDIGVENPEELAIQASDYLENMRETTKDKVKLDHNKL